MAKKQEQPAEPAFTPPGGGGRYQLINGVPVPITDDEQPATESSGE